MQVRLTEEFYRIRSYTHRYDHLQNAPWKLIQTQPYIIQLEDLKEEVTRAEFEEVLSV